MLVLTVHLPANRRGLHCEEISLVVVTVKQKVVQNNYKNSLGFPYYDDFIVSISSK